MELLGPTKLRHAQQHKLVVIRFIGLAAGGKRQVVVVAHDDVLGIDDVHILNREEGDRYGKALNAFQRKVNAAWVDPGYIAAVRKKLDLDQRQAA